MAPSRLNSWNRNCSATRKGAFTGADRTRKGYFEAAGSGTLFLDEIGELPAPAQVKLLRALQEGEVVRVGATKPIGIELRVIAATNRTLTQEVAQGRFREDLYYRLAVAVLKLPPVRERPGDLGPLVDRLLEQINEESAHEPGYRNKKFSVSARNILFRYSWPGNVRELMNTLRRAAIWSDGVTIEADDVREALLPAPRDPEQALLDRALGNGIQPPGPHRQRRAALPRTSDGGGRGQQVQSSRFGGPRELPDVDQLVVEVRSEPIVARPLHSKGRNPMP